MRTRIFNHGTTPLMMKSLPLLGVAAIMVLAGCSSSRVAVQNYGQQAEQLAPVQTGSVSTTVSSTTGGISMPMGEPS